MSTYRQPDYPLHHLSLHTEANNERTLIPYTTPHLNGRPTPPDTEVGNAELYANVQLKLSEMKMIMEYTEDADWKLILKLQSKKSREYLLFIWDIMKTLEYKIKVKHCTRSRVGRNINNKSDGQCVLCAVAFTTLQITQQKRMELERNIMNKNIFLLNKIDEITKQQLINSRLFSDSFLESAQCIFHCKNEVFFIAISDNEMRFISMERSANTKSVFGRLKKAVSRFKQYKFQCDDKIDTLLYGIIRCVAMSVQYDIIVLCAQFCVGFDCIDSCNYTVFVRLKIPLLAHNKKIFNPKKKNDNFHIGDNIYGRHFGPKGCIYDISINFIANFDEKQLVFARARLTHLSDGCNDIIQSEEKLQKQQREKIKQQWDFIRMRCGHLNKMKRSEFVECIVEILQSGQEIEARPKKNRLEMYLAPYTLLINLEGTTPGDIGYNESGKAITIVRNIKNYAQTRKLAEKVKTMRVTGRETGNGYKKRFIYQVEGVTILFGQNNRTVMEEIEFIDEQKDNRAVLGAIEKIIGYKSEERDLYALFDDLFTILLIPDCKAYIKKYDKYHWYFQFVANRLILLNLSVDIFNLTATIIKVFYCVNDEIKGIHKICWLHVISCCCHAFMELDDRNVTINTQWNVQLICYLFELLLQCICCKEYRTLFASPKIFITDSILTYIMRFYEPTAYVLFKRYLNNDVLAPGIINSPILMTLIEHYCGQSAVQPISSSFDCVGPFTLKMLESSKGVEKQQLIRARLSAQIQAVQLASTITAMVSLLSHKNDKMDDKELFNILTEQTALTNKIHETWAAFLQSKIGNKCM